MNARNSTHLGRFHGGMLLTALILVPLSTQKWQEDEVGKLRVLPPLVCDLVSAISPDSRRLALETLHDGTWILDLTRRRVDLELPAHEWNHAGIAWSPEGSRLALLRPTGQVDVVDSRSGASVGYLDASRVRPIAWGSRTVRFVAGGTMVLVAMGSPTAEVWTISPPARVGAFALDSKNVPTALAVSADGELIALGGDDGSFGVWSARDPSQFKHYRRIHFEPSVSPSIASLAFDPKSETLAIGCCDRTVRLWTIGQAQVSSPLHHADDWEEYGSVGCVQFTTDGAHLLTTCSPLWEVRLWDLGTKRSTTLIQYNGGHQGPLQAWLSADNRFVCAAQGLPIARITDSRSSTALLPENPDGVAYKSDGNVAWTMDADRLIVRWIVSDAPELRIRMGYE